MAKATLAIVDRFVGRMCERSWKRFIGIVSDEK